MFFVRLLRIKKRRIHQEKRLGPWGVDLGRSPGTALTRITSRQGRARGHGGTCAQHTRPHHPCHTDTTSLTALLYCHTQTGPGEVVTGQRWCSKTPVRVCFSRSVCRLSRRASASLRIVLSGCDRELKHGFTFPLFLFRCRGSARYLHHAIMQSCNHVIRRISLSLWPLIGGEPRSPYLEVGQVVSLHAVRLCR